MRGRPTKPYHFPAQPPAFGTASDSQRWKIKTEDKSNPSNVTRRSKLVIVIDDFMSDYWLGGS
jgi:hypothetical protein